MRLRVLTLLTASIVAALAASTTVAVAAPASAAAGPPYTALTLTTASDAADPLRPEGSRVYADDQVSVQLSTATRLRLSGSDGSGGSIVVAFDAPQGRRFVAGTTYDLANPVAAQRPSVEVSAPDRSFSCGPLRGSLTVREVTFGAGATQTFAADYQLTCSNGGGAVLTGSARYRSSVPWQGFVTTPGYQDLGSVVVGATATATVTVRVEGSDATAAYALTLGGSGAAEARVVTDTCSAAPLTVGASCTVTLAIRPLTPGTRAVTGDFAGHAHFGVRFTATDPAAGTYYPALPQRILDSRTGLGGLAGGLGQNSSFRLDPQLGVNASALVVTLTVTNPTSAGYVTAYPAGTTRPPTSSINFAPRQTVANTLTVPVAADGSIALYNAIGRTDVIVDYVGYYARDDSDLAFTGRGGGLHPTLVERVLDTRTWGHGRLEPGYYATVPVRYRSDGGHIGALSVNVTVTNADAAGFVSTWDASTSTPPETSTLNFTRGATVANSAIVPSSYCQQGDGCSPNAVIGVYNGSSAPIDVLVDISGFYDDGQLPADIRYHPLAAPTRIVDTRAGQGLARFGAGQTQTLVPPTTVAGYDTYALDANVTAVYPTAPTFLTFWPGGYSDYPRPNASALNPFPGQIVANHVSNEVGPGNRVNVYNNAGQVDLVMDVGGTFELFPATPPDQQGKQARATVTPAVSVATGATAHPVAAGR